MKSPIKIFCTLNDLKYPDLDKYQIDPQSHLYSYSPDNHMFRKRGWPAP